MPKFNKYNNKYIRENIRKQIRNTRNKLTHKEQYHASKIMTDYIINDHRIKEAKNIGLFINFDGEVHTHLLIASLLRAKKNIYLPIINPFKKSKTLLFSQYISSTPLIANKFKIHEPKLQKKSLITIEKINILFIPLVAFDCNGNRIGMGGGFYDHTLNNKIHYTQKTLIGLAHDCQHITNIIPKEPWDVSLPEIITPSNHWIWK